jgi:hypothetical protein
MLGTDFILISRPGAFKFHLAEVTFFSSDHISLRSSVGWHSLSHSKGIAMVPGYFESTKKKI